MLRLKSILRLMLVVILTSVSMSVQAQGHSVTGIVTDDLGPVIGATIVVKGTTSGTTTDVSGAYTINVESANAILVFSCIGCETAEEAVGSRTVVDMKLNASAVAMDELVVVGYGFQKKSHLTGSITKFNPEGILDVPASDITSALQGRLSGVTIQNNTSEVGVSPQIRVRGSGAMNSGGSPLIVIDNFVVEDGLSMVNPSDIASIEVLKDASSSAIYGSRAANGVIIITTKEGAAMKPRYSISVYSGFKQAYELHPMTTYNEYVNTLKQEKDWGGGSVINRDLAAAWLENEIGVTDHQKSGLNDSAMTNSVQFNLSGGRTNLKYTMSGGFLQDDGIVAKNHINKFNLRTRLDVDLSDYVTIGTNISVIYTDSERPENNYVSFMTWPTFMPIRHNKFTSDLTGHPVGSFAQAPHFNTGENIYPVGPIDPETGEPTLVSDQPYNTNNVSPSSRLARTSREYTESRFSGSIYMNIKILPNLIFRTANSLTARYNTEERYYEKDATKIGNASWGFHNSRFRTNMTTDNTLSYIEKFGDHDVNVMAGVSAESWKSKIADLSGTGFPNDYVKTLSGASSFMLYDSSGNRASTVNIAPDQNLFSYFGRINYGFKDRYLISAVFRADGYSLFGQNNKWGYFPSVSVGWRVTEEPFMKDLRALSSLKLRASYGMTGSNRLESDATVNLLSGTLYPVGTGTGDATPGLANSSDLIGNPDLGWAKVSEMNLGFDLGLFDSRVNLVFDYYYSITKDMLYLAPASSVTGHKESWTNKGKLRNKGFEISLETYNIVKKDFTWSTSFNIAHDSNKLLELGSGEARILNEGYKAGQFASIVGEKAIQFYGYKTDGVWKTQAEIEASGLTGSYNVPGGLKIVDVNGDGVLNTDDMTAIGDPYHDFTWGMTNNFRYKGIDLSILFQGAQGGELVNADGAYNDFARRNESYNIQSRWVSETHQGDGVTPMHGNGVVWDAADYFVEDASYVALRNITLGYTFPEKITDKLHLDGLRVYVTGNNLLFFTGDNYKGINPEYRNSESNPLIAGFQRGSFPMATTFTAGIDIKF